jgi:glycosyltransferase involved in cell wall biosynthesis
MTRPAVTVVTGTWGRPKTILERAIPSVKAQDYDGPIEHLIVTDGTDIELNTALRMAGYFESRASRRLVNLGRNWTGFSGDGAQGAIPRLVGSYMAAGEYITYLDDDNEYYPNHVTTLANLLESMDVDLACSRFLLDGKPAGAAPPGPNNTDTSSFMHRASVLKHGSWGLDGFAGDGILVQRWVAAGVSWAFTDAVTLVHHGHRGGAPD